RFDQVRRILGGILDAECGGAPRPQDVTDCFRVHRKLGWQLWNVSRCENAISATRFLPSPRSMNAWRTAAAAKGVSAAQIAALDQALDQFRASLDEHADDRDMLQMIVDRAIAADGSSSQGSEQRWRKQAFAGNAYIWGVRAKRLVSVSIVA